MWPRLLWSYICHAVPPHSCMERAIWCVWGCQPYGMVCLQRGRMLWFWPMLSTCRTGFSAGSMLELRYLGFYLLIKMRLLMATAAQASRRAVGDSLFWHENSTFPFEWSCLLLCSKPLTKQARCCSGGHPCTTA